MESRVKMVSKVSHGFSSNCLWPRLNLRFSSSSSSTTTSNSSPTLVNSLGWLIFFDHERSEMWINPSIPSSSSTNTPKLVMFFTTALGFHFITHFEEFLRAAQVLRPRHFRHVDKSFYARCDFEECTVVCHGDDFAFHLRAYFQ